MDKENRLGSDVGRASRTCALKDRLDKAMDRGIVVTGDAQLTRGGQWI